MKCVIGYIYFGKIQGKEEKEFIEVAHKKGVKLMMFNLAKEIDEDEIIRKAKMCDILFCNSAEEYAMEIVKTIEEIGKTVIDSSSAYYYLEDKWMFYMHCKKNNIPTPETNLLSDNLNYVKKELDKFGYWPIVLKRIEGTCGEYVEKVNTSEEAIKTIQYFWKKGGKQIPIIAQEFIKSYSYRLLVIDGEIVQTVIKKNKAGWKSTGVYGKKFDKFEVDLELKKIVKQISNCMKIYICGIDLLKKDNRWVVLEINSCPGLDFFKKERKIIIGKIIDFLKKKIKKS